MCCSSFCVGNGGGVSEMSGGSLLYDLLVRDDGLILLAAVANAYDSTAASYASIFSTFDELQWKILINNKICC